MLSLGGFGGIVGEILGGIDCLGMALPQSLDATGVDGLKSALSQGLASGKSLVLDASPVATISASAIQLLAAFTLVARSKNIAVQFVRPSTQFIQSFAMLGLSDFLRGSDRRLAP